MNPGGNDSDLYSQIGPGFAAFVVIFALSLAVWFLVRSMNGHLRKVRYAQADEEAREREVLAAEGDRGQAAVAPESEAHHDASRGPVSE